MLKHMRTQTHANSSGYMHTQADAEFGVVLIRSQCALLSLDQKSKQTAKLKHSAKLLRI